MRQQTLNFEQRAMEHLARRGTATRMEDARRAHRHGGARAGIRAYCAGNKWATENARAVGNL